jgi:hypothetical protein
MFVRIVQWDEDPETETKYCSEALYECTSVELWPHIENPENPDYDPDYPGSLSVSLNGPDPIELFVVKDGNTEIYVMNNNGKTIDTHRWAPPRPTTLEVEVEIQE